MGLKKGRGSLFSTQHNRSTYLKTFTPNRLWSKKYPWNEDETLQEWWLKHDTSIVSSSLSKDLFKIIQETNITIGGPLLDVHKHIDLEDYAKNYKALSRLCQASNEWLIHKDGSGSSRYGLVTSLRDQIHKQLTEMRHKLDTHDFRTTPHQRTDKDSIQQLNKDLADIDRDIKYKKSDFERLKRKLGEEHQDVVALMATIHEKIEARSRLLDVNFPPPRPNRLLLHTTHTFLNRWQRESKKASFFNSNTKRYVTKLFEEHSRQFPTKDNDEILCKKLKTWMVKSKKKSGPLYTLVQEMSDDIDTTVKRTDWQNVAKRRSTFSETPPLTQDDPIFLLPNECDWEHSTPQSLTHWWQRNDPSFETSKTTKQLLASINEVDKTLGTKTLFGLSVHKAWLTPSVDVKYLQSVSNEPTFLRDKFERLTELKESLEEDLFSINTAGDSKESTAPLSEQLEGIMLRFQEIVKTLPCCEGLNAKVRFDSAMEELARKLDQETYQDLTFQNAEQFSQVFDLYDEIVKAKKLADIPTDTEPYKAQRNAISLATTLDGVRKKMKKLDEKDESKPFKDLFKQTTLTQQDVHITCDALLANNKTQFDLTTLEKHAGVATNLLEQTSAEHETLAKANQTVENLIKLYQRSCQWLITEKDKDPERIPLVSNLRANVARQLQHLKTEAQTQLRSATSAAEKASTFNEFMNYQHPITGQPIENVEYLAVFENRILALTQLAASIDVPDLNRQALHDNNYFQDHWRKHSKAASFSKTKETKTLDHAFTEHAKETPSKETDEVLLDKMDDWLAKKTPESSKRYGLVERMREHLAKIIESSYPEKEDRNIHVRINY